MLNLVDANWVAQRKNLIHSLKQFSLPEQDLVWIEEVLELHSLYTLLPKTMNIMSISSAASIEFKIHQLTSNVFLFKSYLLMTTIPTEVTLFYEDKKFVKKISLLLALIQTIIKHLNLIIDKNFITDYFFREREGTIVCLLH